ncbi:hypothetical protein YC2023_099665 [Brassica napus]
MPTHKLQTKPKDFSMVGPDNHVFVIKDLPVRNEPCSTSAAKQPWQGPGPAMTQRSPFLLTKSITTSLGRSPKNDVTPPTFNTTSNELIIIGPQLQN